jgi:hypothetical protein
VHQLVAAADLHLALGDDHAGSLRLGPDGEPRAQGANAAVGAADQEGGAVGIGRPRGDFQVNLAGFELEPAVGFQVDGGVFVEVNDRAVGKLGPAALAGPGLQALTDPQDLGGGRRRSGTRRQPFQAQVG